MALSAHDRPCLTGHSTPSPHVPLMPRARHAITRRPPPSARPSVGRPHRRLCMVSTAAGKGGNQLRTPELVDYWAVLGLERGAGPDNVKAAYRRLQKTYHPDSPMGTEERSQALNEAYATLTEMSAAELRAYARELRLRGPPGSTLKDSTGLVGPIRESEPLMTESLPECEAGCDIGGLGDMVDFVRQWAQPSSACLPVQTLAYSSELPLPMPVQCDDIEDGARVGVIAIQRGQVTMVGELRFVVQPAAECEGDECLLDTPVPPQLAGNAADAPDNFVPWVVAVTRRGSQEKLPGETRILRSFCDACALHRKRLAGAPEGFQLGGFLAALAHGALGGVPIFGAGGARSYEAYHLKRPKPMSRA